MKCTLTIKTQYRQDEKSDVHEISFGRFVEMAEKCCAVIYADGGRLRFSVSASSVVDADLQKSFTYEAMP